MSVLSNGSFPTSCSNSFSRFGQDCFMFGTGFLIFITFNITNILLLVPACIFILYRGLQQWWQQRSSSAAATTTHSDTFTYHMVVMELMNVCGNVVFLCAIYKSCLEMLTMWFYLFSATWYGETIFHVVTCVEHYLAVVHPIAYLSFRKERWIRIRNIIIGCIWLLCLGFAIFILLQINTLIIDFSLLISSVIIISFCSLSVLSVLIRPGPGEQGRDRVRVHQSKQRAFYTIVAILAVLLLRCAWNLVWTMNFLFSAVISQCVFLVCSLWVNIPSSLMLPLLFLHRAGILPCCKNNIR